MARNTAVLQIYQQLSPGFSCLLFPRHGLLSKVRNHILEAHTFQQSFVYKPNLKGHGHEGPHPIDAPSSSCQDRYPMPYIGLVPSPGQEKVAVGTRGLKLHFGLLNASATHFDTSGHATPSFLQVL